MKLYATDYDLKKLDFKLINSQRFFPGKNLMRYDWLHPRFQIAARQGKRCLVVTIDNLTCDDAVAEAHWEIKPGQKVLEYIGGDEIDESSGQISLEAGLRLSRTSQPVTVNYVFRCLSCKKTGVLNSRGDDIAFCGGAPVDTVISRSAVRRVTIDG